MKRIPILAISLILVLFAGCKKDPKTATLNLQFSHAVDGASLTQNSILYKNAAGYDYSITKLVYYVSNIRLVGDDVEDYATSDFHYLSIADDNSLNISLPEVPIGKYKQVAFTLGIDNARNVTGGLPTSTINNQMAWPDQMGGGYHHMKLEGMWQDSGSAAQGFAMHLGLTHQANCVQNQVFSIAEGSNTHTLTMNINEWFTSPAVYDFHADGTSIMSNAASMEKLARNGDDVFDN